MGNLWVIFVLIYSLLKGSREAMKKMAVKKSSSTEILFFYTLIGFIITIPFSQNAFALKPLFIFFAFIKALAVCTAWYLGLTAINKMSVSLYGIMDLSRMIFSTTFGVFLLGEPFTWQKGIGIILVLTGLMLVNLKKDTVSKGVTLPILMAALGNCLFNAISGTMDKVLMRYMESSQLQFWFMLFSVVIFGTLILIKREKISIKCLKTNYWIPIMSISLILGDKLLFEANADPQSQVTIMTIIKQSSVIITVLSGWLIFKEKNILYKAFCAAVVLVGILIPILL
ncbi:MAG: DMT family transporter [Eubacteriales bacterium]|nr:DMT family transporter [Eubacteriales bacterium]